jgi:nucleotide-binding universal stress UspA family protein
MYDLILVGTDGSATASRAVEFAARLAQSNQARLTIAHAFSPKPSLDVDPSAFDRDLTWRTTPGGSAEGVVDAAVDVAQAAACGGLVVDTRIEPGTPRAVLRKLIAELQPDAVVVGNADTRRRIGGRGLGASLLRRTTTDILVVNTAVPVSRSSPTASAA